MTRTATHDAAEAAPPPVRAARQGRGAGRSGMGLLLLDGAVFVAVVAVLATLYREAVDTAGALLPTLLLLNGLFAAAAMIVAFRHALTLFMVAFYFDLVFFAAAPLQQVAHIWAPILQEQAIAVRSAVLCLAFTATGIGALALRCLRPVAAGRGAWSRSLVHRAPGAAPLRPERLLLAVLPLALGLVGLYNTALLTTREQFGDRMGALFPREALIVVTSVVHPFLFMGSVVGVVVALRGGRRGIAAGFALAFLAALLIYSPLVQPRFRLSAVLVFLALTVVGWRASRSLFAFLVLGTVVSPVLNSFRFVNQTEDARTFSSFFDHMDYDAFSMLCLIVKYVARSGYDYGASALSSFLFFVPRALWETKSEHVAKIIFDFLYDETLAGTDNLSTPPVAEGYFAYGVPGAVLASVLTFAFVLRLERLGAAGAPLSPATLLASAVPMLLFILLRGPLIVGVSEMSGAIVAIVGIAWLVGAFAPDPGPAARTPGRRGLGGLFGGRRRAPLREGRP